MKAGHSSSGPPPFLRGFPPSVPSFYPSVGRRPSPNGCFETVEGDDPIYRRAFSPRVGRVVPLRPGRGGDSLLSRRFWSWSAAGVSPPPSRRSTPLRPDG